MTETYIKELDDVKELLYSHTAKALEQTGTTQVIISTAIPSVLDFAVLMGCLAQLALEGIETWDIALRQIIAECIKRGGLNQTL